MSGVVVLSAVVLSGVVAVVLVQETTTTPRNARSCRLQIRACAAGASTVDNSSRAKEGRSFIIVSLTLLSPLFPLRQHPIAMIWSFLCVLTLHRVRSSTRHVQLPGRHRRRVELRQGRRARHPTPPRRRMVGGRSGRQEGPTWPCSEQLPEGMLKCLFGVTGFASFLGLRRNHDFCGWKSHVFYCSRVALWLRAQGRLEGQWRSH